MSPKFAHYTEKILNALPHWFQIRKKSSDSLGAQFLDIAGMKLDEMRYVLEYAYEQTTIETADLDFVDVTYKTIIPMNLDSAELEEVLSSAGSLRKARKLAHFFGIGLTGIEYKELYGHDLYFVDAKRNILYVRQPYDRDLLCPDGQISFGVKGQRYTQSLSIHPVWNFFDEFGLILECPRIHGERNREYKTRLMDVFKNPAGAHREGLVNGIARELSLRKEVVWLDGGKDFLIEDPMVVLNSIQVNGRLLSEEEVFLSEAGHVLLAGDPKLDDTELEVSYISGLEMHQVHNHADLKLRNELFHVDSTATDLLKYYRDRIHSEAPIVWGHFKWDEAYWDISDKELSGVAFLPALYDGSVVGFRSYKRT